MKDPKSYRLILYDSTTGKEIGQATVLNTHMGFRFGTGRRATGGRADDVPASGLSSFCSLTIAALCAGRTVAGVVAIRAHPGGEGPERKRAPSRLFHRQVVLEDSERVIPRLKIQRLGYVPADTFLERETDPQQGLAQCPVSPSSTRLDA
jgi:hypothetical protein